MTDQDTRREATGKIAEQLKIANEALKEAQRIADDAGVSFSWDGPTYGMGGYYTPNFEESDNYYEESGWNASSQSC